MVRILKGTYILIIEVPRRTKIKVGKLGTLIFERGHYAYIGSAMNGLFGRVRRHFSLNKKDHWHVDYLLRSAKIVEGFIIPSDRKEECEINNQIMMLAGVISSPRGFGSSDCSCISHLHQISVETIEKMKIMAKEKMWLTYFSFNETESENSNSRKNEHKM